jgi:hypothetical protein
VYLTCDGVHGMWWRKKSPHRLGVYGRGLRCCTCEIRATGLLVAIWIYLNAKPREDGCRGSLGSLEEMALPGFNLYRPPNWRK